jgi:hypothetical protein
MVPRDARSFRSRQLRPYGFDFMANHKVQEWQ